ncbi:MAG: heat shock protein HspQ [Alphaproteobacteria bacterium]
MYKNENNNLIVEPLFSVGDLVVHTKYHFRAVVVDVEYNIENSANYNLIASSIDFDETLVSNVWYKLLIDDGEDLSFMPEVMLNSDTSPQPVNHPLLTKYLKANIEEGIYTTSMPVH